MKNIIKVFLIFIFLFLGCLLSLAFLITDDHSVVIQSDKVTPKSLAGSRKLLNQINHTLRKHGGNKSILIPFDSLNGIFALTSEIFHRLSARYEDQGDQLLISLSIKLPHNPVGNYINIDLQIGKDYSDTKTNRTAFGRLSLSNETAINILSNLLKILTADNILQDDEPLIKNVSIQNRSISILLHPELNTQKIVTYFNLAGKDIAENILTDINIHHVQSYYNHIATSTSYSGNHKYFALYDLLKMVMSEAEKRSDDSNAKSQNTSALIALALFAGDYNLKTTLNRFLNVRLSSNINLKFRLNSRKDLNLHFIYSAMIHIMSDSGISFSIGEIKEVSDSGKGGSGFSFVDIAADKAGIKLAQVATASNSSARLLQKRFSLSTSERDIFPDVFALRENISEDRFNSLYTNRQSDEYKAMLGEIDRRIDALFIYREMPG